MAIFKSDIVESGSYGAVPPSKGVVMGVRATLVVGSTSAIGDVHQMVPVPAGARILDIKMSADGGTTNMTASLGDGGATARFKALAALSEAVAWVPVLGFGHVYTDADTIDVTTAVAKPTDGDSYIMTVMYIVD